GHRGDGGCRGGAYCVPPQRVPAPGRLNPFGLFTKPAQRRNNLLPSQTTGSYLRSATRSFIGISALSVILMFSGHTSVQHLVMLQNPRPCSSWAELRRSRVSSGCISSSAIRIRCRGPANDFLFSS